MHYALMTILTKNIKEQMEKYKETEDNHYPIAKWDNFGVGRRFAKFFIRKDGVSTFAVKISDIDFEAMKSEMKEAAEIEYSFFENIEGLSEEKFKRMIKRTLGEYLTKEEYIEKRCKEYRLPSAFLKDGEWYDAKRSGSEKQWVIDFEKMFDELPESTEVIILDCHI